MLRKCFLFCTGLSLALTGLVAGRYLWPYLIARGGEGGAGVSHAHSGPTIEQVRGLSALTVLTVDVADVQVSDLRGYTGGARAALVVKGDLTLATDLSQARFEAIDQVGRRATLVLPPPHVATPRVDHARTRLVCIWRYGLWQIVPGDRAETAVIGRAYAEAQAVVAAAGLEASLDGRARRQAEVVLSTFFGAMGWRLTVRWVDPASQPQSSSGHLPMPPAHSSTRSTSLIGKKGASMASDQQVSAKHVLQSLMRLKRQGSQRAMADLEQVEPDLAEYLMEELSLLHQKILELGANASRTRWLSRRIESLALVCIAALRQSHFDLWRQDVAAADGPLARLSASTTEENRTDPAPRDAAPPAQEPEQ